MFLILFEVFLKLPKKMFYIGLIFCQTFNNSEI